MADLQNLRSLSLSEVVESLDNREYKTPQDTPRIHEEIIILNQSIDKKDSNGDDSLSAKAVAKLQAFLTRAILPGPDFVEKSPYDLEKLPALAPNDIAKFHQMSSDGLALLSKLYSRSLITPDGDAKNLEFILCLASFTDASDPWTCESSQTTALEILHSFLDSRDTKALSTILSDLLRECIKPAFSKGRSNPAITPEGRKAVYDPPPTDPRAAAAAATSESERTTSPWKYQNVYIVTVLKWIIQTLNLTDLTFIHQTSPNLIPPLLTLIDDTSTTVKAKGLHLLTQLLPHLPPKFLERTGLGDVFEQSLMPCLAYLPPLTEGAESLQLLGEAYPAIRALARTRDLASNEKKGFMRSPLDRLMREGILAGYAQAGGHVKIAEFLTKQMGVLVGEMGMEWVRYLKHLLPLLSANLSGLFALTYPPLLLSTLETLQTIIMVAWPRVPHYRFEILKGLTVCWCRIADEGNAHQEASEELREVQRSIERTVKILTATLKHEKLDVPSEYERIVAEGDERLRGLLIV